MLLLFMQADQALFFLRDSSNMYSFSLLTSGIKDAMRFSKINKCIAIESQVASQNKTTILGMDGLIQPNQIFPIIVIKYNHAFVIGNTA